MSLIIQKFNESKQLKEDIDIIIRTFMKELVDAGFKRAIGFVFKRAKFITLSYSAMIRVYIEVPVQDDMEEILIDLEPKEIDLFMLNIEHENNRNIDLKRYADTLNKNDEQIQKLLLDAFNARMKANHDSIRSAARANTKEHFGKEVL